MISRLRSTFCAFRLSTLSVAGFIIVTAVPAIGQDYRQAPSLASLVGTGSLPDVEDRLPKVPLIVQPVNDIGTYGGTMRTAIRGRGGSDGISIYRMLDYEPLVRWSMQWQHVQPNVAQSWSVSPDGREYEFVLRNGLRWSDGEPFTSNDIVFWFELSRNGLLEPQMLPPFARENLISVEGRGPDRVVFRLAEPNGLLLSQLASAWQYPSMTDYPRHWLRRFIPEVAVSEQLAIEVGAAGARDWKELLRLKAGLGRTSSNPLVQFRVAVEGVDRPIPQPLDMAPTLGAWRLDRLEAGPPMRIVARRNPYYWKVDPAGQQLPYLDEVAFILLESTNDIFPMLRAGELDFQLRRLTLKWQIIAKEMGVNWPYRSVSLVGASANYIPICLNQTHSDKEKRAIFAAKPFRVALSLAIDRRKIIEEVMEGKGEPWQVAPRRESAYFDEQLATQYLDHAPKEAERLLDELGLSRRGPDGIRLFPDGRPLAVELVVREEKAGHLRALAMVAAGWRSIGIGAQVVPLPRREVLKRVVETANFDVIVGEEDGGLDVLLAFGNYAPVARASCYGPRWQFWYFDPAAPLAEEPPAPYRQQVDDYRAVVAATNATDREQIVRRSLSRAADLFPMIGIANWTYDDGLVSHRLRNVPQTMVDAWTYPTPGPTNPSQYYLAD